MSTIKLAPRTGDVLLARRWLEEARDSGRTDSYSGKRDCARYTWDAALEVHVTPPRGRPFTVYATGKDISGGGIGIHCRQAIPIYSNITICLAGELTGVPAVVTHCTPTLSGHIIGTRFKVEEQAAAVAAHAIKVG